MVWDTDRDVSLSQYWNLYHENLKALQLIRMLQLQGEKLLTCPVVHSIRAQQHNIFCKMGVRASFMSKGWSNSLFISLAPATQLDLMTWQPEAGGSWKPWHSCGWHTGRQPHSLFANMNWNTILKICAKYSISSKTHAYLCLFSKPLKYFFFIPLKVVNVKSFQDRWGKAKYVIASYLKSYIEPLLLACVFVHRWCCCCQVSLLWWSIKTII